MTELTMIRTGNTLLRVKGHLEEEWGDWFDGMSITHDEDGETTFTGPIVDQPALFGLLLKVSQLNLALLSVAVLSAPGER